MTARVQVMEFPLIGHLFHSKDTRENGYSFNYEVEALPTDGFYFLKYEARSPAENGER